MKKEELKKKLNEMVDAMNDEELDGLSGGEYRISREYLEKLLRSLKIEIMPQELSEEQQNWNKMNDFLIYQMNLVNAKVCKKIFENNLL